MDMTAGGRKISVYECGDGAAPLVILNTVHGEGGAVLKACLGPECPPFNLAAVSELDWDRDMSPWSIPPIAPGDTACSGGADEYLETLTGEMIPAVEEKCGLSPRRRILAGYSLAGLFAVYSAFLTDIFDAAASASGSLWFPGFCDFVSSHEVKARVKFIYLSLGDLEDHTDNGFLSPVRKNTEKIAKMLKERGENVFYELNPGNHFREPAARMAKGIIRTLDELKRSDSSE